MKPRVTVVGSMNMDLVARAPRIPQPGETIMGSVFQTVPGGKGANQAVAAARLGAQVSMVGRVGCDAYGDAMLDNLSTDGIDHSFVLRDPKANTGVALVAVDDSAQNSIVVVPGANMQVSPADIDAASPAIQQADALILQLECPVETVVRAAQLGREQNVLVVLNPAPARPLPKELLSLVDVLIPNETETMLLTKLAIDSSAQLKAAAAALHSYGVGTVIITLGKRGAFLSREDETKVLPAYSVNAIDATAAGDAFVAGFAVALAEGQPMVEAVRWGTAAGALATTRLGAQSSLPTRREVANLIKGTPL